MFYAQHRLACFEQLKTVPTIEAAHPRWIIGTLSASIPAMPMEEQGAVEKDSEDVTAERTEQQRSGTAPSEISQGDLFNEMLVELCALCSRQSLEGVITLHTDALQKVFCDAKKAFEGQLV